MKRVIAGFVAAQLVLIGVAADTLTTSSPGRELATVQPGYPVLVAVPHRGEPHPWHPAGMPWCHAPAQRDCLVRAGSWRGRFGHSWTVLTRQQIRALRRVDGSPPRSWQGCWLRDDHIVIVCPWFGYRIESINGQPLLPVMSA